MPKPLLAALALLAVPIVIGAPAARAVSIDGTLDPEYGPPLVTQTTQTSALDSYESTVQTNLALGSELDAGYGYVANGVLHLFLSGNLTFYWDLEGQVVWLPLDLFIDAVPGGQHTLLASNPAPDPYYYDSSRLAGLTFDAGFEADYWLSCGANPDVSGWPNVHAYYGVLPGAGGGAGAYLGTTLAGGPGTLTGGSNPYGIQFTLDERNLAGVTAGCGGASGTGVATGIEWAIPLAAIGNPTGCVKVCAFVSTGDHSGLWNQVLGPLPPGTCSLGAAGAVDFSAIAGDQFFTVCSGTTPARASTWGRLKAIYR